MSVLAVIDVETTGLNPYRHDRIIEIAAVVIRPDGRVVREFVSLVNPERDIGPTSVHGLTAGDVLSAPRFGEIAAALLEALDGSRIVAGHNVRFDRSFLTAEFDRLGLAFPQEPTLCTLQLAGGGTLSACCSDYQVAFDGKAHAALYDARATARLLAALLSDAPHKAREVEQLPPIAWPKPPKTSVHPLTRDESRQRQTQPPAYLQRLLTRVSSPVSAETDDSATLAYSALLDRALEDRRIDESEGDGLVEVASRWGIDGNQVRAIHREYLHRLAAAALADGVVTDAERRDLTQVARLLGVEYSSFEDILEKAAKRLSEATKASPPAAEPPNPQRLAGTSVCFTGECLCRFRGQPITRDLAAELATKAGVSVIESVTKKLGVLVVADPHSQSGKAKKARQYGIRVIHEPVFWKAIGVEVE